MYKKLTLNIDENIYYGLRSVIGERKISRFIENLVRPYIIRSDLEAAYKEMAKDGEREKEANAWCENFVGDATHEEG